MVNSRYGRLACTLVFVASSLISGSSRQLAGILLQANGAPIRRPGQSATLLPDGRWLLVGGQDAADAATLVVVDPVSGQSVDAATRLTQPRSGHSATVLADGTVLIVGGALQNGDLADVVERFDPRSGQVQSLPDLQVTPRSDHSATLLTNGDLLLVGGLTVGGRAVADAETLDVRSDLITPVGLLMAARSAHQATLAADGRVVIDGGVDGRGRPIADAEIFDPNTLTFVPAAVAPVARTAPRVSGSMPVDGDGAVSPESTLALRLSEPLKVTSANPGTVSISSSAGVSPADIVPAEGGRLVFVVPRSPLRRGETYRIEARGLLSDKGERVPAASISFVVAREASPFASDPDEDAGGTNSPWRSLKPLQAGPNVTAIAGQVLQLTGAPLANVTVKIGKYRAQSDHTGRFLVIAPDLTGHQELLIDGRTASSPGRTYGVFEVGVDVQPKKTMALAFTSWMPRIDTAHAVTLLSPTVAETIVSTPDIPGLELHIPAGTVIRDVDGAIATEVSVTPIPLDRPPFPLPPHVYVPIYFTIQPGSGYMFALDGTPSPGARLFYPNYRQEVTGKVFNFWRYDPDGPGWNVYGEGRVSADRRQIILDPGVRIYEFTGAMVGDPSFAPAEGPKPGNESTDGEPVDLGTGLFVSTKTDLAVPDVVPISLTRTYRTRDGASRPFGIGSSDSYEMFLVGDVTAYTYTDLILPDGGRIHYARISSGTGFSDAVFEHTGTQTRFYKSRILWNSGRWQLTLTDKTIYEFPDGEFATRPGQAAVTKITDRFGNAVVLTRDSSGNLTHVQGTNSTIDLTYDASSRISQATDNIGRHALYQYDASGHLWKVTDVAGGVTEYSYDAFGRMRTIKDPRGITYVTNVYDANSRVAQQVLADGGTYLFSYTLNAGTVTQTDVTDPRGMLRRVTFSSTGYWTNDIRAVGRPEQQTVGLQRDPTTNVALNSTDTLGRTTSFGYDAVGNLTSITRLSNTPDAVTTTAAYESTYNQLTSLTDPLNKSTTFIRGYKGALVGITDPSGRQVSLTTNSRGQVTAVANAVGTVQLEYSGAMVTSITNALGFTRRRFIDGGGRTISSTDALGRSSGIEYSPLNQPLRVTDALNGITVLTYDGNGNTLSVTDANNGETVYTFDPMDRVATRTDPLSHAEQYTYDQAGNLSQFTDRRGQVTNYVYDGLNRVTRATYADGSTTGYTYDGADRLTQVVDSIAGTITLGWDGLDRLTSEGGPKGSVGYTYDAAGRRTTMTVAGQPTVAYTYDDGNRLTQITQGSAVVGMAYDTVGRRALLTLPNGISTEYDYDQAHELSGLTYKLAGNVLGTLTYTYDATGHRITQAGSFARTRLPQPMSAASYNAANQLTQWGGAALTYDPAGNMLSEGDRTFDWDTRNRLTAIGGTTAATFSYDGSGRRLSKTVNGVTSDFLYDELNVVQELSAGVPTVNVLGGLTVDETFSRTDASATSTLLSDALGSTVALGDGAGAVQTQYTYEPFGATSTSGAGSANPVQYTGRENDGTGVYFYRNRYYSPTIQRFVSEDPIGFGGGGVNFYAYVGNDPINLIDPSGLTWASNWNYFGDWSLGRPPNTRNYGPNDVETQEMMHSPGGNLLRDSFNRGGCKSQSGQNYGTVQAYWDTTVNPLTADWSGTGAEVGGFGGASVINNGNGSATFTIPNTSGTYSFFLHLVPDRRSQTGPMSNIYRNWLAR